MQMEVLRNFDNGQEQMNICQRYQGKIWFLLETLKPEAVIFDLNLTDVALLMHYRTELYRMEEVLLV